MKIINSKHSAKELNEIYEREEAKVNHKLRKQIGLSETLIFYLPVGVGLIVGVLLMLFEDFKSCLINLIPASTFEAKEAILAFILFIIGFVPIMSYWLFFEKRIRRHFIKKGEILENPLAKYKRQIDFIESGEVLVDTLEIRPNADITMVINEDKMTIIQTNKLTKKLIAKDTFLMSHFTCGVVKKDDLVTPNGDLDFSICDKELEEVLKNIQS